MHIGLIDLVVIYAIPLVIAGAGLLGFLVTIYLIVKLDIGHLDVAEDIRYNIELKKQPVTFMTVAMVMLLDSGVQAAFLYRCARFLYRHRLRPIATVLHKLGKYMTNVDLPPTAKVGPGVVFLHCCNIVIGPYIEIGSHVVFRPCVVLRGWGTVKLEDGVRTGLQSVVMDCVTMGNESESAPGAVVTQDVPPRHIAFGMPATKMVPRPETKLRGIVIELENVLLEETNLWVTALGRSVMVAGKDIGAAKIRALAALPPPLAVSRYVRNKGAQEAALNEYLRTVRDFMHTELRLKARAVELLNTLRGRGLKVGVISRHADAFAQELAAAVGIKDLADLVTGTDGCLTEWKPEPWIVYKPMRALKLGVERVIYIAGSLLDVRTGIQAALRVFWLCGSEVRGGPPKGRGLVTRFDDMESLIAEFSKPQLPQTL